MIMTNQGHVINHVKTSFTMNEHRFQWPAVSSPTENEKNVSRFGTASVELLNVHIGQVQSYDTA